jgi:Ribosomal protein L11 methyltransferase (PrmA)
VRRRWIAFDDQPSKGPTGCRGDKIGDLRDFQVGRHEITLALREDVGPVSLYSQLLAEHIPDLTGQTVVDVGSGSGFLAIVARFQGAKRVYLLDRAFTTFGTALLTKRCMSSMRKCAPDRPSYPSEALARD